MSNFPDALPRLAVGSHKAGSGKACLMNAVSMINGDTVITDMPSCTDPLLSEFAQRLNDSICSHRNGVYLCGDCTHLMWLYGARIIGTSTATAKYTSIERAKLAEKLARFAADQVQHLRGNPATARAAARVAAAAANAAEYANAAESAAEYAAEYAKYAADAAFDAAAEAAAIDAARYKLHMKLVDEFYRLTGYSSTREKFSNEEIAIVREQVKV